MAKTTAPEQPISQPPADAIPGLDADNNCRLQFEARKLVCRSPARKRLASVPKKVKESELAEELTVPYEWLLDHRNDCVRRVETWMLRSLPVACDLVRAIWPDRDWADMLRNLVVAPTDAQGQADATHTGLLLTWTPKRASASSIARARRPGAG